MESTVTHNRYLKGKAQKKTTGMSCNALCPAGAIVRSHTDYIQL